MRKYKDYKGNLDKQFLRAHDIRIIQYQPWQFGLYHPDLYGKFVWYPMKGTLMYQCDEGLYKVGEFTDTEVVVDKIMSKITEQK